MVNAKVIITVLAIGFPSLLLVSGLIIYSGASFVNAFIDASEQMSLGKMMIFFSILIYLLELLIYFIIWYNETYGRGC